MGNKYKKNKSKRGWYKYIMSYKVGYHSEYIFLIVKYPRFLVVNTAFLSTLNKDLQKKEWIEIWFFCAACTFMYFWKVGGAWMYFLFFFYVFAGVGESRSHFILLLSLLFFCSLSLVDSDDLLKLEHCSIYTTDEMSQGDERGWYNAQGNL